MDCAGGEVAGSGGTFQLARAVQRVPLVYTWLKMIDRRLRQAHHKEENHAARSGIRAEV